MPHVAGGRKHAVQQGRSGRSRSTEPSSREPRPRGRYASRSGTGHRARRWRSGRRRCAGHSSRRAPRRRASRSPPSRSHPRPPRAADLSRSSRSSSAARYAAGRAGPRCSPRSPARSSVAVTGAFAGLDQPALHARRPARFVDTHSGPLDGVGEPADQAAPAGCGRSAVSSCRRAPRRPAPAPRVRPASSSTVSRIATGLAASVSHLAAQAFELSGRPGDAEPPALHEVGVDASDRRDPGNLGYGVAHRQRAAARRPARSAAPARAAER